MLKDITLGQYFPGTTAVHRLDPRTKLLWLIAYIVALFLAKNWASYALMLLVLVSLAAAAHIKPKTLLSGLKPLILIVIFTALINLFYGSGEPLVQFWIFKITADGIRNAVFMVLRILLLVCGTFLLTYTTSPLSSTSSAAQSAAPRSTNIPSRASGAASPQRSSRTESPSAAPSAAAAASNSRPHSAAPFSALIGA